MKFLSFQSGKAASYGAVIEDGVYDLGKRFGKQWPTLRAALKAGKLGELKAAAKKARKADLPLARVRFLPVIPDSKKIICVGLNYRAHREETGRGDTVHPTLFLRLAASQVGHGQPLIKPKESQSLDWECELAVIIGRAGRRVPKAKAMGLIAGYSCYNDGSVRDYQRHTSQFTPGKNFVATGGFGPYLVTPDEVGDITKQTMTTKVNGVEKQRTTIDMMITDIPSLIEYITIFTTLQPGDVIVTGTPGGVGAARNPPEFMKPGDVCEVEISNVGLLRNTIKEG